MRQWTRVAVVFTAGLGFAGMLAAQSLTGAGATFPNPIYSRWFEEFRKAHPSVQINYQSIGSGAGIKQLTVGTVDFGASDMPMNEKQLSEIKVKPLHFPTVLGAVVPIYNVPGVNQELKFTADVLAKIFMRKITKWNDPQIVKVNPGVKLPGSDILVIHRSDGSGTTFVFADYLSKTSAEWKKDIGADTALKWPTGTMGQKGNEGVTGFVKQTPGSIGYTELTYALQTNTGYGQVQNSAGTFVKASLESVTAAAAAEAGKMPADFRASITNAAGKDAYPISTFTWLLIPSKIGDAGKKKALVDFLHWMLADGQKDAATLHYAPLPKAVADRELKQIAQIQ
jgi:phosphate transport system substrate-binding protein